MAASIIMAGELWQAVSQVGLESAYGQAVAASRKVYGRDVSFNPNRDTREHMFSTGTRDNVRNRTLGPKTPDGSITIPASASELPEWLLTGVKGGVTPTTPASGVSRWTFTPGTTLASMTCEYHDGAQLWQVPGVRAGTIGMQGSANGENLATIGLVAADMVTLGALTGALAERTPTVHEGWQCRVWMDAFSGSAGSTIVVDSVINWNVQQDNKPGTKFFANRLNRVGSRPLGALGITAQLTLEAASSRAITEFANWDAETKRLVMLEFGNVGPLISGSPAGVNEVQTITITGTPTGGTFPLTFEGFTTAQISFNATAAQVQAALRALPNLSPDGVTCAGGPLPGTPVTATFGGPQASRNVQPMTTSSALLTGGTTPTVAVSTTTPGVGWRELIQVTIPGTWQAMDLSGSDAETRTYSMTLGYVYDPVNAYGIQWVLENGRATAW